MSDASTSGQELDLFVDNVRVRAGTLPPSSLTIHRPPPPEGHHPSRSPISPDNWRNDEFHEVLKHWLHRPDGRPVRELREWLKNGEGMPQTPAFR
ncbi:MAG: hypothetical protein H7A50_06805 [Akkermansiaceae bacterium]|nr:hypothetical protein [Akkermansiaceae bacterium]